MATKNRRNRGSERSESDLRRYTGDEALRKAEEMKATLKMVRAAPPNANGERQSSWVVPTSCSQYSVVHEEIFEGSKR